MGEGNGAESLPHREEQKEEDGSLAWLEGSVERCDDSELREEEEQGEDGSDFT